MQKGSASSEVEPRKSAQVSHEHTSPSRTRGFRPEIQALRAVAVLLVLVYHLWPAALPGGYVGVDVFFVISGFLITEHPLRDVAAHGRVRLASFWAKRMRRLLPAALVVLAVTTLLVPLAVHPTERSSVFEEVRAAALYFENWHLAASSVDYLQGGTLSPIEQYWSLSTEGQLYAVWPVLVLLATGGFLQRRLAGRLGRARVTCVVGTVTLMSLLLFIVAAQRATIGAYFWTPVRAWEFGAGALLAVWRACFAEFGEPPRSCTYLVSGSRARIAVVGDSMPPCCCRGCAPRCSGTTGRSRRSPTRDASSATSQAARRATTGHS